MIKHRNGVLYKAYPFRGRDPILNKTLSLMDDTGMSNAEINRVSGVSTSTMGNWRRKTRKPMFCTIEAVARACGKTLVFVNKR